MAILGTLLYVIVLALNAITVLSEDRFLARVNLTPETHRRNFGENPDSSIKYRTIQLVSSIRTLARIPLIIVNTLIIFWELIFG
ncbi:Yos1-like protein [Podospora fimiseda]|uniref:Yos1-like protein n=1 Tax=Podospora fimiseda TaxID=252190 RepID=A0AAN7BY32_9PEZI|nr:Yos1-like protein [Podospora fimiseda]